MSRVFNTTFLSVQVDRSVTGLVAQQQCVGPLHTPLADVAVTALTHFDTVGSATSIGEQPIKGLIDPASGARMSVAEALTNLVFARVSSLKVGLSGFYYFKFIIHTITMKLFIHKHLLFIFCLPLFC